MSIQVYYNKREREPGRKKEGRNEGQVQKRKE